MFVCIVCFDHAICVYVYSLRDHVILCMLLFYVRSLKGSRGIYDVFSLTELSGLSFDSTLLSWLNLVSINQTEGSTIPSCPSLMCFLIRWYLWDHFFENLCWTIFAIWLQCGIARRWIDVYFQPWCCPLWLTGLKAPSNTFFVRSLLESCISAADCVYVCWDHVLLCLRLCVYFSRSCDSEYAYVCSYRKSCTSVHVLMCDVCRDYADSVYVFMCVVRRHYAYLCVQFTEVTRFCVRVHLFCLPVTCLFYLHVCCLPRILDFA